MKDERKTNKKKPLNNSSNYQGEKVRLEELGEKFISNCIDEDINKVHIEVEYINGDKKTTEINIDSNVVQMLIGVIFIVILILIGGDELIKDGSIFDLPK